MSAVTRVTDCHSPLGLIFHYLGGNIFYPVYVLCSHQPNKKIILRETARGIPNAGYQVLRLLSYPGQRGAPHPDLARWEGKVSHPWLGGTPSLAGGTPSWPGQPEGYPILTWPDGGGGTPYLGSGIGVPPQEGTWDQSLGYPQKGHGTSGSIMGWKYYEMETSPPEQTDTCENITSRRTAYAVGNDVSLHIFWRGHGVALSCQCVIENVIVKLCLQKRSEKRSLTGL